MSPVPHGGGFLCVWSDGSVGDCVALYLEDWIKIREYYLTLERELKAACLALGGLDEECGTEDKRPRPEAPKPDSMELPAPGPLLPAMFFL